MNAETLHAIDAIYLENFLEALLYKALYAEGELRACLRHAETLSGTEYLSPDCRSRYEKIRKRLAPLVSKLGEFTGDLYRGGELTSDYEPLVHWELIEDVPEHESRAVIERLELAERELLTNLNHIGKSLVSTTASNVSWESSARIKTYLKLKSIPERPCYQDTTMVQFCASPPFHTAHYFAKLPVETYADNERYPWLLDDELFPLVYLPLFENLEIELEVRGTMTNSGNKDNKRCG